MYVSLGRFQLHKHGPAGQDYWAAPPQVTALVDLTPTALDHEQDVNYALMVSASPLDSNDLLHQFGESVTDRDRNAWESITGYRPSLGLNTVNELLIDAVTLGSQAAGVDRVRPLSTSRGRVIEVWLGGREPIFQHKLNSGDPFDAPITAGLLQGIRDVSEDLTEEQLQKYYGALAITNAWTHQELLDRLPANDARIPRVLPLKPRTTRIETWPSAVTPTANQDQPWATVSGSWTMHAVGSVRHTANPGPSLLRLDAAFSGAEMIAEFTAVAVSGGTGLAIRANSAGTNHYLTAYQYAASAYAYKNVNGSFTALLSGLAVATNDILNGSAVGSTIRLGKNGNNHGTVTDTSITSGAYVHAYAYESGSRLGRISTDDQMISSSAGVTRTLLGVG